MGHWSLLEIASFDRYEFMLAFHNYGAILALSCIISEVKQDIGRKS